MDIFTVSLFGHRDIDDIRTVYNKLAPIIRELIQTKFYVEFLIGRNGEFDKCAASIIKQVQKENDCKNSDITLVLPYMVADFEYYEKYYDNIIIPNTLYGAHPKSAIMLKNRWMAEHSDLIIAYIERRRGGAYSAVKYAESLNKTIINLNSVE